MFETASRSVPLRHSVPVPIPIATNFRRYRSTSKSALRRSSRACSDPSCRFSKELCDALAAKCFGGRSMTIERCRAAFLLWVELEAVEAVLVRRDERSSSASVCWQWC